MDITSFLLGYESGKTTGGGGSGGGGGTLPPGVYMKHFPVVKQDTIDNKTYFVLNDELYGTVCQDSTSARGIYKITSEGYQYLSNFPSSRTLAYASIIEFEGEIHILGQESTHHYIWDGASTWRTMNRLPKSVANNNAFIWRGGLCVRGSSAFYQWNKADDSWTEIPIANFSVVGNTMYPSFMWNGDIYTVTWQNNSAIYKVENDAYVKVVDIPYYTETGGVFRDGEWWFAYRPDTNTSKIKDNLGKVSLKDGTFTDFGDFVGGGGGIQLLEVGEELHLFRSSYEHYTIHVVEGE